jgi:hypothetical protein
MLGSCQSHSPPPNGVSAGFAEQRSDIRVFKDGSDRTDTLLWHFGPNP